MKNLYGGQRRSQIRDNKAYLKERLYDDAYDVERSNASRYYDYSDYDPEDDNNY